MQASGRRGAVLQIAGEAGIGKTRLAGVVAGLARRDGRLTVEARAQPSDAALPLGVFQDALRADRRARPDAPAPESPLAAAFPSLLLPELGGAPNASAERGYLFEAACAFLRELASPGGLVVVLEDLHWADPTSLALVSYLARTTADDPLLLVLTYRLGESPAGSALARLRHELARNRLGEEIVLDPLDGAGVEAMLEGILGRPADPAAHAAIARMSGGNPFVVEELVRHAVQTGHLDAQSGRWSAEAVIDLPWTVQEMVLERVRQLSDDDQELLRWAAVIGPTIDLALLGHVSGVDEPVLIDALARLQHAGLVRDDPSDPAGLRTGFRHALIREAILGGLIAPQRRRRHSAVLDSAEAMAAEGRELDLEELAGHAIAAGDRRRGFEYSLRAARRSVELSGYSEAESHFGRALDLWDPVVGAGTRADLLLDYGRLLARVKRDPRGAGLLAEARAGYLALGDRTRAAEALAAAAGARWNAGLRTGVLADLRTAAGELGRADSPEAHLHVLPILARALWMSGDLREAAAVAAMGLDLVPRAPFRAGLLAGNHLRTTLGSSRWLMGEADEGDRELIESLRLAREHRDDLGVLRVSSDLAYWHLNRTASSAASYADDGLALARERDVHLAVAWLSGARSLIHLKTADWELAEALLLAAERELDHLGPDPEIRLTLRWVRGEWLLGTGALEAAVAELREAAPRADDLENLQLVTRLRRSLARALVACGDADGAAAALAPALERWTGAPGGPLALPVRVLVTCAEVATAAGDLIWARRLAGELEGRFSSPRVRYALALTDVAAGVRPDAAAFQDAARAIDADGWALEAARMRLSAAAALARTPGGRDDAEALAREALTSFDAAGLVHWRRQAEGLLRRLGARAPTRGIGPGRERLTAREIEVLRLVASGASNRGVAERLVISEKTAARHVANLFTKLGVHTRAEAARMAAERGLLAE